MLAVFVQALVVFISRPPGCYIFLKSLSISHQHTPPKLFFSKTEQRLRRNFEAEERNKNLRAGYTKHIDIALHTYVGGS